MKKHTFSLPALPGFLLTGREEDVSFLGEEPLPALSTAASTAQSRAWHTVGAQ